MVTGKRCCACDRPDQEHIHPPHPLGSDRGQPHIQHCCKSGCLCSKCVHQPHHKHSSIHITVTDSSSCAGWGSVCRLMGLAIHYLCLPACMCSYVPSICHTAGTANPLHVIPAQYLLDNYAMSPKHPEWQPTAPQLMWRGTPYYRPEKVCVCGVAY